MRLAIVSAVASALIGFACAAIPLSDAVAQAQVQTGQLDPAQAQPFLSKVKEAKAGDPAAASAGMAAAPAMIQAAGLTCTPTEARLIGTVDANEKGGKVTYKAIETTCKDELGYIILQGNTNKPTYADCLAAKAESGDKVTPLTCKLDGNNNTTAAIQGLLQRAKSDCVPTNAAYLGGSSAALGYEVACQGGTGVVLQVVIPHTQTSVVQAASCYGYSTSIKDSTNWPCKLTSKDSATAVVKALAAKATPPCTPSKERWVSGLSDGSEYFEFACEGNKGVIVQATNSGKVLRSMPCAQAGAMCTLTQVDLATVNADLTTRVKAAGLSSCDVAKFQALKLQAGVSEALEVSCKSGPGGVLITKADKTMFFDCGRSQAEGYACGLNGKDAANLAMTAQLKAQGKNTCVVSATKALASATSAYVEVACADGAPGYMIKFPRTSNTPAESYDVYTCHDAKAIGGGCSLPTNKAS